MFKKERNSQRTWVSENSTLQVATQKNFKFINNTTIYYSWKVVCWFGSHTDLPLLNKGFRKGSRFTQQHIFHLFAARDKFTYGILCCLCIPHKSIDYTIFVELVSDTLSIYLLLLRDMDVRRPIKLKMNFLVGMKFPPPSKGVISNIHV